MLDFVKRYLPFWCPGPDHGDARDAAAKVREILGRACSPAETLRKQLNDALKERRFVWWGRFGDLLSADSPFAGEIRDWFWSNGGRKNGSGVVPRDQTRRFAERLQEYGL